MAPFPVLADPDPYYRALTALTMVLVVVVVYLAAYVFIRDLLDAHRADPDRVHPPRPRVGIAARALARMARMRPMRERNSGVDDHDLMC